MLRAPVAAETFLLYLFILCGLFCAAGYFIFYRKGNLDFRRKWYPRYIILSGMFFGAFVLAAAWSGDAPVPSVFLFMLPLIALLIRLNIKHTRFCSHCTRIAYGRDPLTVAKFCPYCGAALDA